MGARTTIGWTEASWNPLRARKRNGESRSGHYCEKVSSGCAHCYASTMQPRLFQMPTYLGEGSREVRLSEIDLYLDSKTLNEPLIWRRPRRVFVCSMTDLFGSWVPDDWIRDVLSVVARTTHCYQVLTKRPERMRDTLNAWYPEPLPNLWAGVSVENQAMADQRIPVLLQTVASVRFLSVEPLLARVDLRPYLQRDRLHWVIVGGESGPIARPCDLFWLRQVVQHCQEAGIPCFVKQLGSRPIDSQQHGRHWVLGDAKGESIEEFPPDLRVRQYPDGAGSPSADC